MHRGQRIWSLSKFAPGRLLADINTEGNFSYVIDNQAIVYEDKEKRLILLREDDNVSDYNKNQFKESEVIKHKTLNEILRGKV